MSERFADFDAAFAERDAKPLLIRLYGRMWELPGVMPAEVPLKLARYMADGRGEDELNEPEKFDLAAALVPSDTLQAWMAKGLDAEQLGQILLWVLRQYHSPEGGDGPELAAPVTGPSSSDTGVSSPPTSDANTVSPFPETSGG